VPQRGGIESGPPVRITEAGEARLLVERGARRDVLERLTGGRVVSIGALVRKPPTARLAVAALEAEVLVAQRRPRKGRADASRRVSFAAVTAQGRDDLGPALTLGARQQQAMDLL